MQWEKLFCLLRQQLTALLFVINYRFSYASKLCTNRLYLDFVLPSCFNASQAFITKITMRHQLIFVILITSILTAGCTTTHDASPASTGSDVAAAQLAEAATSISQSLGDLDAIQRATYPTITTKALPNPGATGILGSATVDWTGPVGPLLEKIAATNNYKVRTLGVPPAIPIIVSISAKNTPLAYIVRDADFQCGKRANIRVYPSMRVIELRYANT